MILFPFNENQFSFYAADHLLVSQLCTNPKSDRSLLSCLKVTQCSTSDIGDAPLYKLRLSTDPSYDNRTIDSTLKIQIWIATNKQGRAQGDENKVSRNGNGLWCGFKWGPHHATSHLRSRLESQHQSVPGCAEECGDPLVQSGGRWQTLSVAAGLSTGPQGQRDPGLASERVLRLCSLLSLLPSSPDLNPLNYFVWSYVENITNMTSHNSKASLIAAICRVFAELPTALVEKACSEFRIRIEAVIELKAAATLNRCQLNYIIK